MITKKSLITKIICAAVTLCLIFSVFANLPAALTHVSLTAYATDTETTVEEPESETRSEEEAPAEEAPTAAPVSSAPKKTFTLNSDGDILLYSADKKVSLKILLPGRANDSEKEAAGVLAGYVSQITGYEPAISEAGTAGYIDEFYAAGNKGAFIVIQQLEKEGDVPFGSFILRAGKNPDQSPSDDKNLYIEAYDARGLFNGVYFYLKEFCGVNVYSADVKAVPQSDSLTVADSYYLFYKPVLEYADTDWISPHNVDFAVANGLNGTYSPIDPVYGGSVKYITFCHSLSNSIVPAGELFETNPEYFSLDEDMKTRTPDQLCLSNPEVVNRAIEDVLRLIDENYDEDACLNIISVTQDDNQNYCRCENCTAIAERYGGQSGLMLWFVNQIAEAVAASDHSDVLVDTFAYQYTRKAPTGIQPRDNVCVRLCSIECCFAHTLDDPTCERNADFINDLKDWSEICSRLYIWDYTTNYSQTLGIFPDFGVLQSNVDTFVNYNVVGIYEEGAYYVSACNTEFADLRAYLLARYMYDPLNVYNTASDIRDGFLSAYYGEGAGEIGRFVDYITEHAGNDEGHLYIGSDMRDTLHDVSKEDVKMLDALWDDAAEKASAAGNDAAAERINRSRLSWEYYKACCGLGEYKRGIMFTRWINANEKLISSLESAGVTRYNEGKTMDQIKASALVYPSAWASQGAGAYIAGIAAAALMILLGLLLCLLAAKRKRQLLILAGLTVCAEIAAGIYARLLFKEWKQIALYFAVTVIICLLNGFLAVLAAYAKNGFTELTIKKALLSFTIGFGVSLVPFEILIFLVNNVIFGGGYPGLAFVYAAFWLELIAFACVILIIFKLLAKSGKKNG